MSYDVTTPGGREELRARSHASLPANWTIANKLILAEHTGVLLDYIEELEERCEELAEILTDVPRRYIDRMRSDV